MKKEVQVISGNIPVSLETEEIIAIKETEGGYFLKEFMLIKNKYLSDYERTEQPEHLLSFFVALKEMEKNIEFTFDVLDGKITDKQARREHYCLRNSNSVYKHLLKEMNRINSFQGIEKNKKEISFTKGLLDLKRMVLENIEFMEEKIKTRIMNNNNTGLDFAHNGGKYFIKKNMVPRIIFIEL